MTTAQACQEEGEGAKAFGALFGMDVLGLAQGDPSTGRLLRVNRMLASLLDYEPAELVGRRFLDITHPDDRQANEEGFARMVRGEIPMFRFEKRLLQRNGDPVWVQMAVSLLRDEAGQPIRTVAAIMDLKALRQAQAGLAQSESRLKLALDAARLGMWEWNLSSGEMRCSGEMLDILGLARSASCDMARFRRLVHPADVEVIWAFEEAAREAQPFHADYRIVLPRGEVRWVAHHAMTECDVRGRPVCVVGTLADITLRKSGEEALREAKDRLEARVGERTHELLCTNERLSNEVEERRATEGHVRTLFSQLANAEEEERRRLARDVHDSMGQHVTALTLGLRALEEDPGLPPELRGRLSRLLDSARRIDHDIDDLAYRLHPTVLVDLGLDDALRDLVRTWADGSGTAVDILTRGLCGNRFPPALETTVYRVVQEALTNIRKHAGATRVSLIVEQRDGKLRVIVEDDGKGFVPGMPLAGHTHLGLRSMAERAAQLGGHFDVESSPDRGTAIYFEIPVD